MTRQEFKNKMDHFGIEYLEVKPREDLEFYMIYIHGKKELEMKKAHPRKYKDLYVPEIRVSHFEGDTLIQDDYRPGRLYVKDCGVTYYLEDKKVIELCKRIGLG